MSRTEGVSLPRLPTSHTRVTSSHALQPVSARAAKSERHRRALSEPSYTAYIGTPRQDVPHHVYHNAAMYDDVFDKQGKLFIGRNTPKIVSPLNTIGYSSLNDPHCRKLFLNNRKLRSHLMTLGLITDDLKVVATTAEQRQKIRAHELLERKEQLILKLEQQEKQRLERLQRRFDIPPTYRETVRKEEDRKERMGKLESIKIGKIMKEEEKKKNLEERNREAKRSKLKQVMENARLSEQAQRNAERDQQEFIEVAAYERMYSKHGKLLAKWHRDSDILHNKMIVMERKHWAKLRNKRGSTGVRRASDDSEIDIEATTVPAARLRERSEQDIHTAATPQEAVIPEAPEAIEHREKESAEVEATAGAETRDNAEELALQQTTETPPPPLPLEGESTAKQQQEDRSTAAADTTRTEAERGEDVEEGPAVDEGPLGVTAEEEEVLVLDQEQSAQQFTQILVDTFESVDHEGSGYLSVDSVIQVLDSRDLGLQLVEQELLYIAGQVDVYGNGYVPFAQLAPSLLDILLQLYNERAQTCIEQYGGYTEEQWCEIFPPKGGVCYLHKLSGVLQYGRPRDFRPTLEGDVFEESIVDFFEATDSDKDGVIDYEDFYALLLSPMVSTRIYSNQTEELLQLYENVSFEGRMTLEQFAEVARALLLMIYQNTYPDVEEWIELQCRKFGTFWFNKNTGESHIPGTTPQQLPRGGRRPPAAQEDRPDTSKGKRKKSRRSRTADASPSQRDGGPSQSSPPPLRKRVPRTTSVTVREGQGTTDQNETETSGDKATLQTTVGTGKQQQEDSSIDEREGASDSKLDTEREDSNKPDTDQHTVEEAKPAETEKPLTAVANEEHTEKSAAETAQEQGTDIVQSGDVNEQGKSDAKDEPPSPKSSPEVSPDELQKPAQDSTDEAVEQSQLTGDRKSVV